MIVLRCDSGGNHRRAVPIAHIILDNKYWTDAPLFAADHRAEIGIVNISPFDAGIHFGSLSDEIDLRFVRKPIFPTPQENITVV